MATDNLTKPTPSSTAIQESLNGPGPGPKPIPLIVPDDVKVQMRRQGHNPDVFQRDLNRMQQEGKADEAMRTYGVVIDRARKNSGSTSATAEISRFQHENSGYQADRIEKGPVESLSAWDDFGRQFMNGAVVSTGRGIHFLATALPTALDSKNPDWIKTWQDTNAQWYEDNKLFVSPQAEAGIFGKDGDVNWRGVAGTVGNTLGMMTATFAPMVGLAGKAGQAAQVASRGAQIARTLTGVSAQSGAISFLQMFPMYNEEARKAGYSPSQALMASIPMSAAQAVLEHVGMDQLMKSWGIGAKEAGAVVRSLRQEAAGEAFSQLAGKPLTEETFKSISNELGMGFLKRIRQPEVVKAALARAGKGGLNEFGEEGLQGMSDAALKKVYDIYYGYGKQGDETKDGKGFDPGVKESAVEIGVGSVLGGLIGGSMGAMFSRGPNKFYNESIYGKVDADVRDMAAKGVSLANLSPADADAAKTKMGIYKILETAKATGQIDDQVYAESRQKIDTMVGISEQLSKSVNSPAARFGLYDLNTRQQDFNGRFDSEISAPLQRLSELADQDAAGNYVPKQGLPVLDLAEANALIAQNLPARQQLGQQIKAKIDSYVADLVNPNTRQTALTKYATDIDTDMRKFDQAAQPQQDSFSESEMEGLVSTMETPKGRFAVRRTADPQRPREVVEVKTDVQGARADVNEDRDPVIDRFRNFDLPTKGKPAVSFVPVDEQLQSDMLDAFDQNDDMVQDYDQWRKSLDDSFVDDPMEGLRQARDRVNNEAAALDADPAPTDWKKSDLQRKQEWVRNGYRQLAEDPANGNYTPGDFIADQHFDWLIENNATPEQLAALPDTIQNGIYDALKNGNEDAATKLLAAAIPLNETINPAENDSRPSEILAQLEAEGERNERNKAIERLAKNLSGAEAIVNSVAEYIATGQTDPDVEKLLARQLDELSAYNNQLAAYLSEVLGEEPVDEAGNAAGSDAGSAESNSAAANDAAGSSEPGSAKQPPRKRKNLVKTTGYDPVVRAPESTREAILQYFTGKGRIRTEDVKRYGDPNWMRGAKGGNPLISYVSSSPDIENIDQLALRLRVNENEDEQDVINMIMEILSSLPANPPKAQLVAVQQEAVEQQLVDSIPEYTPMEIMVSLMEALDRSSIPTDEQEQLMNDIANEYVTADGLDWLGVYNLMGFRGLLKNPTLKAYVFGEYLNQIANFVELSEAEMEAAAKLTPSEIKEILSGAPLSDEVFAQIMEPYALTGEQIDELNNLLGQDNPNQIDPADVPILYPGTVEQNADPGTNPGAEEIENLQPDVNAEPAPAAEVAPTAQNEPVLPVNEPVLPSQAPTTPAEEARIQSAVDAAVAEVNQQVSGLERKIANKRGKVKELLSSIKKRVGTGNLNFGDSNQNAANPPAATRPTSFAGQLVTDGTTSQVSISPDPVATPETVVQVTADNKGFVVEAGPRISRIVTYRNYMVDPYFTAINGDAITNGSIAGAVSRIVTVVPAIFNPDGTVKTKGKVFYEIGNKTYERHRAAASGAGQQADLTDGTISGLEAENAVRKSIAELETQIAALEAERNNVAATKEKVAEVARKNAKQQGDLFAPPPVEQKTPAAEQNTPAPGPVGSVTVDVPLTPEQIRRAELEQKKAELAKKFNRAINSTLNAGVNPEVLAIGLEYFMVSAELGIVKFRDFVRDFSAMTGTVIGDPQLDALKAVYTGSSSLVPADVLDQMDDVRTVRNVTVFDINNAVDAPVESLAPPQQEMLVDKNDQFMIDRVVELGLPPYVNRLFNRASISDSFVPGTVAEYNDPDLVKVRELFAAIDQAYNGSVNDKDANRAASELLAREGVSTGLVKSANPNAVRFANGIRMIAGPLSPLDPQGIWGISTKGTQTNEPNTTTNPQPDSPRTDATDDVGSGTVQPGNGGRSGSADGTGRGISSEKGLRPQGNSGTANSTPTLFGESGDIEVPSNVGQLGTPDDLTRTDNSGGSDIPLSEGIQPEPKTSAGDELTASLGLAAANEDKLAVQAAADKIPVVAADRANIDATLPYLMEGQREDVHTAEVRFQKPDGYGMVFTNGTGTGKTFLGLGIIKRFINQGKTEGLIVVPNDPIIAEWLASAPALGIKLTKLTSTSDKGKGLSITTYANFSANNAIARRKYDFLVMDEAHKLMSSQKAEVTAALDALRAVSLHPNGDYQRTKMLHPELWRRIVELNKQIETINLELDALGRYDAGRQPLFDRRNRLGEELTDSNKQFRSYLDQERTYISDNQLEKRPRVTFLSATPFAYRENVQWAEGYLYDYPKDKRQGSRGPDPYSQFMIENFGYRWRNNSLNKPETGVDLNLMERMFNSKLKEAGVLSARMLDIDSDYQRVFALTPSAIGSKIDEGMTFLREYAKGDQKNYFRHLHDLADERFNYTERQRLLEAIKANEAIPLIKQWHAMGRKVVVYYDFIKGGGFNPFDFSGAPNLMYYENNPANPAQPIKKYVRDLVAEFNAMRPDLVAINTGDLLPPLQALSQAFPNAGHINGQPEYKKRKLSDIRNFNDDSKPEANLLLVQSDANAGWSGHDKTSMYPRVSVNLGMPTAPTKAIQIEGRTYRSGQHPQSNSMFVYLNTGTGWERMAFASTISARAGTAENLAMGENARGLKDAFIQAYEESEVYTPNPEEGRGGKELDRSLVQAITPFAKSISLYYANQKKSQATKAAEGVDYFATPEPLGYKMVEWAGIRFAEDVLEPSAGHGAIARWFPDHTRNVIVEPSFELASRAKLTLDAKLASMPFEEYSIVNKHDAIVMNPPYGTAGKTASEHLKKAATQHLRNGGRVLAIVPVGSFDDKFNKWFDEVDKKGNRVNANLTVAARILLPSSTFNRAGTGVNTQIIVIDRIDSPELMAARPYTRNYDLTYTENVNELFEEIKDMDIVARPTKLEATGVDESEDLPAEVVPEDTGITSGRGGRLPMPAQATQTPGAVPGITATPTKPLYTASDGGPALKPTVKGIHSKYGFDIYTIPLTERQPDTVFTQMTALVKKHGGYYSSYNRDGAIEGFIFKDPAKAARFFNEVTGGGQQKADPQYGTVAAPVPVSEQLLQSLVQFAPTLQFANMVDGGFDQAAFDQAAREAGLANDESAQLNGFRVGNKVYLNPSVLNAQTALHEVGHVWQSVMESIAPEVVNRGLDLMAGTEYEAKFLSNPAYAQRAGESDAAYQRRIRSEALVEAIADKGIRILNESKRTGLRKFLADFWKSLKEGLARFGINFGSKANLEDMTLEQYTDAVARQMVEGQPATPFGVDEQATTDQDQAATTAAEQIDAQYQMPVNASRPISNPRAERLSNFRQANESKRARSSIKKLTTDEIAVHLEQYIPILDELFTGAPNSKTVNTLKKIRDTGPFKGAPGPMYDTISQTFNPDLLNDVARSIKGQKTKYGDLTDSLKKVLYGGEATADLHKMNAGRNSYIDENGDYVAADVQQEEIDLTDKLDAIKNHRGAWGQITKLLNSKAAGALTLPETLAHWLSDKNSQFRRNMETTRRAWVARASELMLSRQQQIDSLSAMFAGISLFDGRNTVANVKTETFDGFANGRAQAINLPVAVWMHMVATHRTQQATYNGRSSVAADMSQAGQLIPTRFNSDGQPQTYGYEYRDPNTRKATTYLLEASQLDAVEAMLNRDHKPAFDAAKKFFTFQPALDYLQGLHRTLNGKELEMYGDYFPTTAVSEESDPLTAMPKLLKNAKITQARQGLPHRVRGGDMLSEIQNYARREEHYIGNVVTLVNLQKWKQRNMATLDKDAPEWIQDYIEELEIDLNDPTARARKQGNWTEVKVAGVDIGLRPLLRRFTTSVFSFSPALPLKQVMTMLQGVGLGIVENQYLIQATTKDLAPLFAEAYHLARQNDDNAVYGTTLKEGAYLQEMAKNGYLATVLLRAIGRNEAFIGSPSLDELKANPVSAGVQGARKVLHTISDYGLGAVRRSDRAVLLSFWKAAQYQVQADIASGKFLDATGQPVTDMNSDEALRRVADLTERLVYDTNQMTAESDRTPLQRDKSLASTLIGLYSGQQQRLLNTFMQKYADWLHTPDGSPQKDDAFRQMMWVGFNNIVLNAALMAVISMMWRMVKKMITGDNRPEQYAQTLAWDTARGVLGSFPSIPTEGLVMLTTMTDNQKWSSGLIEYAPGEAIGQVVSGLQQSVNYLGEESEAKKAKLLSQIVYNMADGGTKITGLPNSLGQIVGKLAKKKPVQADELDDAFNVFDNSNSSGQLYRQP